MGKNPSPHKLKNKLICSNQNLFDKNALILSSCFTDQTILLKRRSYQWRHNLKINSRGGFAFSNFSKTPKIQQCRKNNAPWRLPNTPLQSTDIHQTWNRSPNFSQQCKETKGQLHKTSKKIKTESCDHSTGRWNLWNHKSPCWESNRDRWEGSSWPSRLKHSPPAKNKKKKMMMKMKSMAPSAQNKTMASLLASFSLSDLFSLASIIPDWILYSEAAVPVSSEHNCFSVDAGVWIWEWDQGCKIQCDISTVRFWYCLRDDAWR